MSKDRGPPPSRVFGARVRDARVRRGLDQGQLGAALGLSRQHVTRLELGWYQTLPADQIRTIAEVLGVDVLDLLPRLRSTGYAVVDAVAG